ncbi:hypothetical protein D8790_06560 [Streptococcus cristatus]|uniref:Uncharacterized protein n=1 Tax=Streptococcus cristatus TaxID=45634 RepID=A0A3R9MFC1_STRCR|nr:hypothetical protein D8790_06560 [Streptococcus cristatus]
MNIYATHFKLANIANQACRDGIVQIKSYSTDFLLKLL